MRTRNDPLYRVIELPPIVNKVDGKFNELTNRLDKMNSLGLVAFLHQAARYPKAEHRYGLIHQVKTMLDSPWFEKRRKEHGDAMLLSACFLHLGHMPFTVSSERAFLLACRQDEDVRNLLTSIIDTVYPKADMSEAAARNIERDFLCLNRPHRLYRWISAYRMLKNESKTNSILDSVDTLKDDNSEIMQEAVRNLVDSNYIGYDYLKWANRADYIQRDGLYFGTVRLDISAKHLYKRDFLNPIRPTDEWALLAQNRTYLVNHIYEPPRLKGEIASYEHMLAHFMSMQNFDAGWMLEWSDLELKDFLETGKYENERIIYAKAAQRGEQFLKQQSMLDRGLTVYGISHSSDGPAGLEDSFVEHTGTGLFRYPFEDGFAIRPEISGDQELVHDDKMRFDVGFYVADDKLNGHRFFSTLNQALMYSEIRHQQKTQRALGALLTHEERCEISNESIQRCISEGLKEIWHRDPRNFRELWDMFEKAKLWECLWNNFANFWQLMEVRQFLDRANDPENESAYDEMFQKLARSLLAFPVVVWSYKQPNSFLKKLKDCLWSIFNDNNDGGERGCLFEAICLVDRILDGSDVGKWIYINGLEIYQEIETDANESMEVMPTKEFDIIEMYISGTDLHLDIREVSIDLSDSKEEEEKRKMTWFMDKAHEAIPDAEISSLLVRPSADGGIEEESCYVKPPAS